MSVTNSIINFRKLPVSSHFRRSFCCSFPPFLLFIFSLVFAPISVSLGLLLLAHNGRPKRISRFCFYFEPYFLVKLASVPGGRKTRPLVIFYLLIKLLRGVSTKAI